MDSWWVPCDEDTSILIGKEIMGFSVIVNVEDARVSVSVGIGGVIYL